MTVALPLIISEFDKNARERIRVTLDQYAGRHTIDVRTWWHDGREWRPGRHGITTSVQNLLALAEALTKALARARAEGLLGDG